MSLSLADQVTDILDTLAPKWKLVYNWLLDPTVLYYASF